MSNGGGGDFADSHMTSVKGHRPPPPVFDYLQYEIIGPWWIITTVTDADYYPLPGKP